MFTIIKPERRQNIFLNPSAEGKLGYRVVNGTVSRSDARSHWGRRSWLVTPSGAGCYLELDAQAASNETHVLTIWAAGGEPTELRFGTGAAQPARVADDGEWSCYQAVFAGSQVSGGVTGRIYVNRATYLDDAQMEAGRIRSSSLNGSMGFGYRWNGTRDYATSERLRYFKRRLVSSGGIEKILDDGERVRVSLAHGVGVPPVRIRSAERETGDGEIHLDRTLEPRAIRLMAGHQLAQATMDRPQPHRERIRAQRANTTAGDVGQPRSGHFDQPEAGHPQAGINTEYAQRSRSSQAHLALARAR